MGEPFLLVPTVLYTESGRIGCDLVGDNMALI